MVDFHSGYDDGQNYGRNLQSTITNDILSTHRTVNNVVMVLSLTGSSLVLLTALMFPSVIRGKTLSFTITMVSFNNWLNSIAMTMGFPTGTKCIAQGVISVSAIKGSWLCVILVCHQLRKIITTGKLAFNIQQTIYLYVGYQIFSVLYILAIGVDFGIFKEYQGYMMCSTYSSLADYAQFVFFVFEYLMMIAVIYEVFLISRHVSDLKTKASSEYYDRVNSLKKSAWMYPIFMLVVWTPLITYIAFVSVASTAYFDKHFQQLYAFALMSASWSFLDGFFNALVYFYNGKGVRNLWSAWLSEYAIGRAYLGAIAWIQRCLLAKIPGCSGSNSSEGSNNKGIGSGDGDGDGNPLHLQFDQESESGNGNERDTENQNVASEEDFLDDETMELVIKRGLVEENNGNEASDVELSTSLSMSGSSITSNSGEQSSAGNSPMESFKESKRGTSKYNS